MEKGFEERRLYSRINVSVRVRIEYTGQEFSAQSRNISASGVFLETDRRLPVGTRVRLVLTVPIIAKYPIRAEGEVAWISKEEPGGMAVRFVDISDDDRSLLGELAEKSGSLSGEG